MSNNLESKKHLAAKLKETLEMLEASIADEELKDIDQIPTKHGGVAAFFQNQFEWEFVPARYQLKSKPLTEDAKIYQSSLLRGPRAESPETWELLYAALGLSNVYRESSYLYFKLGCDGYRESLKYLLNKLPDLKVVFDPESYRVRHSDIEKRIDNLRAEEIFITDVFILAGKD